MQASRIPSLDGLRALSICLVLFAHVLYGANSPMHYRWWTDGYAHAAVRIFFIISGFLITSLLLRERDLTGGINVKQFYIRRAFKILPAGYVFLIVATFFLYDSLSSGQLAAAYTWMSSYVDMPWFFDHLLSMSVEIQFYILWPLVMLLGAVLPKRVALAAVVLAPLGRVLLSKSNMTYATWYSPASAADAVAIGCLLGLYQSKLQGMRSFFTWKGFPLIWAATLAVPLVFPFAQSLNHLSAPLHQVLWFSAISIFNLGMALCIQNAMMSPPRILNAAIPVWIGGLSYALYICYMPFTNPDMPHWATTFPVNLMLIVAAALALHYGVERPFLRLRDRGPEGRLDRVPARGRVAVPEVPGS